MAKNEDEYFDMLLRYLRILNRRKIYIIICALAFAVGAAFYAKKLPNVYRASTTIIMPGASRTQMTGVQMLSSLLRGQVSQTPLPGLTPAGGPGQNLVSLLKSRAVAEDVAKHLNLTEGRSIEKAALSIRGGLTVFDLMETIVISYESTDPRRAVDIANYYPVALRNYLDENFKEYRTKLKDRVKRMESLLRNSETMFKKYERQFSSMETLNTLYQSLVQQHDLSRLEEDVYSNFTVLDSALVPEAPVRPDRRKIALIGLLIGLVTGIVLGLSLDAFDNRIYEMKALEDKIGMPILGNVMLKWRRKNLPDMVNISGQDKIIRRSLERAFAGSDTRTRKIVFSSVEEIPEKAILLCKIGRTLSERGKKVAVINYNTNTTNIYNEISQRLTPDLLPPGSNPVDGGHSGFNIESTSTRNIGSRDLSDYDYVLVDAPSGIMSPSLFDLVEWADVTFAVVKIGSTFTKELILHKESLEKVTDHVQAIVITPPTFSPLSLIRKVLSYKIA
ncbi:MAG: Wzz/FepE/Etk N-terminal domain-containing protein [Pseudomonadota bacterium]